MGVTEKINIVTKHLLLEKEKAEVEFERIINTDIPMDKLCKKIVKKLNKYRDATSNVKMWLDFVEPINEPEEGNNK